MTSRMFEFSHLPQVRGRPLPTVGERVPTGMPRYSIEASVVHPFCQQRGRPPFAPPPRRISTCCEAGGRRPLEDRLDAPHWTKRRTTELLGISPGAPVLGQNAPLWSWPAPHVKR